MNDIKNAQAQNSDEKGVDLAKDLLIEDHRYLSDSFWKNEETGETRVNLFIGLVTLVVGGLVTLITNDSSKLNPDEKCAIIMAALVPLFVLGLVTLLRILIRNQRTDEIKRNFDHLRQTIKDHSYRSGIMLNYYPFGISVITLKRRKFKKIKKRIDNIRLRKFGGLAHTMATINSLLVSALAGTWIYYNAIAVDENASLVASIFPGALYGFGIALIIQLLYIVFSDLSHKKKIKQGEYSHAGGLVYKLENGEIKYLLVHAKENKNQWLFPKGHIEDHEGHGETAIREVREEAGVEARLLLPSGSLCFDTDKEFVRAKYYLMEHLFETKPEETREHLWLSFRDALNKLTFENSKQLLKSAEMLRKQLMDG